MALDSRDLFVVQRTFGADSDNIYKATAEQISDFIASTPAVHYMGARDFTKVAETPGNVTGDANPQDGDLWVNSQTTSGRFAWGEHLPKDPANGTSNLPVNYFDKCIWNSTESRWDVFAGNTSEGTLTDVTAEFPLEVDRTNAAEPDISIKAARETNGTKVVDEAPSGDNSGVVEAIAVAADVAANKGSASPNPYAVVPAHLLKVTNEALADATAGGVTDVNGVNPKADDIPDHWKNDADTSTYATPAINVYDGTGNVKDVYVEFATENQVGVSYIAPASGGAVIEFTNAMENNPEIEDGSGDPLVDNHGMMTTRRTFVNFVPRDFSILNDLPAIT